VLLFGRLHDPDVGGGLEGSGDGAGPGVGVAAGVGDGAAGAPSTTGIATGLELGVAVGRGSEGFDGRTSSRLQPTRLVVARLRMSRALVLAPKSRGFAICTSLRTSTLSA
jgi:hypothetical protein